MLGLQKCLGLTPEEGSHEAGCRHHRAPFCLEHPVGNLPSQEPAESQPESHQAELLTQLTYHQHTGHSEISCYLFCSIWFPQFHPFQSSPVPGLHQPSFKHLLGLEEESSTTPSLSITPQSLLSLLLSISPVSSLF